MQSAVKIAVACAQAGVEHLCGLRLRVVPEASWHPWAENPCELLLFAGDEEAWLSLGVKWNQRGIDKLLGLVGPETGGRGVPVLRSGLQTAVRARAMSRH